MSGTFLFVSASLCCVVLCCVGRMELFVDRMGIKRTRKRESERIRELATVLIVRRSTCFDSVAEHGKKERERTRVTNGARVSSPT